MYSVLELKQIEVPWILEYEEAFEPPNTAWGVYEDDRLINWSFDYNAVLEKFLNWEPLRYGL